MGKRKDKDPGKQKNQIDPLQVFAERLRRHKSLESRWALLVQEETRVEYVRGKDLAAFLREHRDLSEAALRAGAVYNVPSEDSPPLEEQVVELLMERQLLLRCDRVVKTLRQGKKKLSKWPAKLDVHPDQDFTEDDGFYAWTFEMRTTYFMAFMSALVPVLTLAACLFPVFPRWAKLGVLYTLITLLSTFFLLLMVRGIVFAIIWVLLGRHIWFFPNFFSEDVNTLSEALRFMPTPDKEPRAKLTTRLLAAVVTAFVLWGCFRHVPDENQRAAFRHKAKNKIDEWLAWNPAREALSGGDVVGNEAERGAESKGGFEAPEASGGLEAEVEKDSAGVGSDAAELDTTEGRTVKEEQ